MPSSVGKIRVPVCDDRELFGTGVVEILSVAGDVEVGGLGDDHEEAVVVVSEGRLDAVLLDLWPARFDPLLDGSSAASDPW